MGRGRGRCLAVFIKLHISIRLTIAADAAVALRVNERAGVAKRTTLKLPLAELDGAASHAKHKALAIVVQAVRACPQCGVDVGEGHACWHSLLAEGTSVGGVPHLSGLIPRHGRRVVFFEGVDTVISICRVLLKTIKIIQMTNKTTVVCLNVQFHSSYSYIL